MLDARFAVNLRPDTISPTFRRFAHPWGYLVPPTGLTRSLRRAVDVLASSRVPAIVDNGNFDDISRITAQRANDLKHYQRQLVELEARLRRRVTWRDLSAALRNEVVKLSGSLAHEAGKVVGMPLKDQITLASDAVIGAEDITAALWLRAGLDVSVLGTSVNTLRLKNEAVAARAREELRSIPRGSSIEYLAVASALDYDSAFEAGHVFGVAGLRQAAMGFGAFMADDSFADNVVIKGRTIKFERQLPMRYLRCALVARGFWDGWKAATGGAPERFHFLGLGAPIMIPVVAVAAARTPLISFDATSPIKDAVEGTIYSSKGAYLKIRTWNLAARLASGALRSWTCPCGFCRGFVRKHPFDYVRGRLWEQATRSL